MPAPVIFGDEVVVLHTVAGAIPKNATMVAVPRDWRCASGRFVLRFKITGGDVTIGDGTSAHVIGIVGQRLGRAAPELIGFAGISLGGAMPVIPLLDSAGANPREWAQIVELDGYQQFGVTGFAGNEAVANTLDVTLAPILDGQPQLEG